MGSDHDVALYRVDVRVPLDEWAYSSAPELGLPDLVVDPDPPASGPEVQLSFTVGALSDQAAELRGRALMAARGLTALAIRSRRRDEQEAA